MSHNGVKLFKELQPAITLLSLLYEFTCVTVVSKKGFRQKPVLVYSFMFIINFYKTKVPLLQTNFGRFRNSITVGIFAI